MTYVVTVDTFIPEGTPEMDPLQRAGAVALIEDGFAAVRAVEGPDGVKADLLDTIVSVHPGGALLKVVVDAPALEFAEDSVQVLVDELLERTELLADWTIERCEVELHQDRARASLDAAEGPDAPPDDPAARKARHAAAPPPHGADDGQDPGAQEPASVRAGMLALADELRPFPSTMFGTREDDSATPTTPPTRAAARDEDGRNGGIAGVHGVNGANGVNGVNGVDGTSGVNGVDGREGSEGRGGTDATDGTDGISGTDGARLAAGSLLYAADALVDQLFEDMEVLAQEDTTVAECEGPLWHLERLPDRYALQYDAGFARRFLVTVIAMTTRFADGTFRRPGCVAEELALRFLLHQATATLELHDLLDDGVSAALDAFTDTMYEGMHHEWLYDAAPDDTGEAPSGPALGFTPTAFASWFTPFDDGRYVHPHRAAKPEGTR